MEEILQKAKEYFQSKTGFPVSKKIQLDSISVTKLMADYAEYEKIEAEKQPLTNVEKGERFDEHFLSEIILTDLRSAGLKISARWLPTIRKTITKYLVD